jgi:hypothetical protein
MNSNKRTLLVPAIATFLLSSGLAEAQDSLKGAVMVVAKGTCTRLVISGENYSCKLVMYSHFQNGRTAWQVPMPNSALMLAGGRDSQLDPTKYVLEIDRLRAGHSDGSSQPYPAKGRCVSRISADGRFLYSLSCSATNGIEDIELEFEGDGSPVSRKIL